MKKLLITLSIMSIFMGVGCSSQAPKSTEQEVVTKEVEEIKEELIEEEEEAYNEDELIYHLTTNMSMDEYDAYFQTVPVNTKFTIPVKIVAWNQDEKYDSRFEMILNYYNGTDEMAGPIMKTNDISYISYGKAPQVGDIFTVTLSMDGYKRTYDWIEVTVKEIQ